MPELVFKGKEFVYNHHLTVPFRPLITHPEKSLGEPRTDGNLVIHGDNLHALKSLLPLYEGQVDCIFIDPPYNTGNEGWAYNDNVNSPMLREWLNKEVGLEDGLRHDKWACMMWPRLKLLHQLLSEEGSFWMTLDDNEVHHALAILDEIFGSRNRLACAIWEKADSPRMDAEFFSYRHDYLIAYAKDKNQFEFNKAGYDEDEVPDHYDQLDGTRRYYLKPLRSMGGQGETRASRPNLYFEMVAPDGTEVFPKLQNGQDGTWRWSKRKVAAEAGRLEWKKGDGKWTPYYRIYADQQGGRPPETIFPHAAVGSSRTAKAQLKKIFSEGNAFDTPKPVGLISEIVRLAMGTDGVILDTFAGSGTTAHAALAANARDGGSRRFILVETEDYADTLTAERVRRVATGYAFRGNQREELLREALTFTKLRNADALMDRVQGIENLETHRFDQIEKKVVDGVLIVTGLSEIEETTPGLGGEFTYCTLGDPVEMDALLTGVSLPAVEAFAALLFNTATSKVFDQGALVERPEIGAGVSQIGVAAGVTYWLIYEPRLEFLRSSEAALTLARARAIASTNPDDKHVVFAAAKFVSRDLLIAEKVAVDFAPLPFALTRVEG